MADLRGVCETLLLSVYARALESRRPDAILHDPESVAIVGALDYDFAGFDAGIWSTQVGTAIRTRILREAIRAHLARSPGATVVNLGAGLSTHFSHVDDGLVRWFDLDLPEVRPYWERLIGASERRAFVEGSVLDVAWMDRFASGAVEPLFLAEGLLMYLPEASVRALVLALADRFPGSEILFEALSPLAVRFAAKHPAVVRTGARFLWGLDDLREIESWGPGIRLVEEWSYLDRHPERWRWMRWARWLPPIRRLMRIGRLRLGAPS